MTVVLVLLVAWCTSAVALALAAGPLITHRPASPHVGVWLIAALLAAYLAFVVTTSAGHHPAPVSPVTPATAAPAVPFQP